MAFSAAATASSDFLTGRSPTIQATDTSVICQRYPVNLTTADLANGTCGVVGILPAGHIPVAFELDAAQLDSNASPTLAYSVGVVNAAQSALPASGGLGHPQMIMNEAPALNSDAGRSSRPNNHTIHRNGVHPGAAPWC